MLCHGMLLSWAALLIGGDERRRSPRKNRVSEGATLIHTMGNPINQQQNSGFNSHRFSVVADNPLIAIFAATAKE
jgi:hypothetical protein